MKQKHRYRRKKKGAGHADAWPASAPSPEDVASRAKYVGSAEHKARPVDPSYDVDPDLRSDASQCDPAISRDEAENALRSAILAKFVSADFQGDFPSYVWGWINDSPYIARLINREAGQYKGWPIGEDEMPKSILERRFGNEDTTDV